MTVGGLRLNIEQCLFDYVHLGEGECLDLRAGAGMPVGPFFIPTGVHALEGIEKCPPSELNGHFVVRTRGLAFLVDL